MIKKIAGDTHTHSIACGHAYSTVSENAAAARALCHRFMAFTEHGPAMNGCPPHWFFQNFGRMPRVWDGLVFLGGCEANVLEDGSTDLGGNILKELDWVLASMHRGIVPIGLAPEKYTHMWLKIAENPYIDCIGHMEHSAYPCDYETVIRAFAKSGKAVEVNSSSPTSRPGSEENSHEIIRLCKKLGVPMVLSSDAHFSTEIGSVDWAAAAVAAEGYPEDQLLNLDYQRFRRWLERKKGLILPE